MAALSELLVQRRRAGRLSGSARRARRPGQQARPLAWSAGSADAGRCPARRTPRTRAVSAAAAPCAHECQARRPTRAPSAGAARAPPSRAAFARRATRQTLAPGLPPRTNSRRRREARAARPDNVIGRATTIALHPTSSATASAALRKPRGWQPVRTRQEQPFNRRGPTGPRTRAVPRKTGSGAVGRPDGPA
jgi:hypothetical protein